MDGAPATRTGGRGIKRITVVVVGVALVTLLIASAALALGIGRNTKRFDVEVSEDHTRFVFAGDHLIEGGELDGLPAYGDSFVTQGYIYPAGTLDGGVGVNEDGSPAYPDKVIGEWTCYGVHVGDGAATTTGPWVVTTQIFNFGDGYGEDTLVTTGYEIADLGEEIARAVTGGTGTWQRARGEQTQVTLGFTEWFGLQFENSFRIRR